MRFKCLSWFESECLPGALLLEFWSPDGGIILGGCGAFRNWGQERKAVAGGRSQPLRDYIPALLLT